MNDKCMQANILKRNSKKGTSVYVMRVIALCWVGLKCKTEFHDSYTSGIREWSIIIFTGIPKSILLNTPLTFEWWGTAFTHSKKTFWWRENLEAMQHKAWNEYNVISHTFNLNCWRVKFMTLTVIHDSNILIYWLKKMNYPRLRDTSPREVGTIL